MQYVYPAIFRKDKDLQETYSVEFPDVEGAVTQGKTLFEAIKMAEDVLNLMLVEWEDSKKSGAPIANKIKTPSPIDKVVAEPDEFSSAAFVNLITADTDAYRKILA